MALTVTDQRKQSPYLQREELRDGMIIRNCIGEIYIVNIVPLHAIVAFSVDGRNIIYDHGSNIIDAKFVEIDAELTIKG